MIEFKESYNRLLESIRKYRFREDSPNGYAINQNKNSHTILFDLQILNGILNKTLQIIDQYLIQNSNNEYTLEKLIASNSLKEYIKHLNYAYAILNNAMYEYYYNIKNVKHKNSAVRAREWKKSRNNALSTILGVSSGLSIVGDMIKSKYPNNYDTRPTENFQKFINHLGDRPNRYSYLSTSEQKDITEIHKSIKEKKRTISRLNIKQSK